MENVRDRVNIVLISTSSQQRFQTSKPQFRRFVIFSEDVVGVELLKTNIGKPLGYMINIRVSI